MTFLQEKKGSFVGCSFVPLPAIAALLHGCQFRFAEHQIEGRFVVVYCFLPFLFV